MTFAGTVLQGFLQLGTMVVLARLLAPQDYGFYALGLSVSAMTTGMVMGTIERTLVVEPSSRETSGRPLSIFLLLVAVSISTVIVCAGIAYYTSWALNAGVLAIVCAAQAVSGLGLIARVRLRRDLSFGRLVVGDLAGQIFGTCLTAIILASVGWGAYALATALFVQNLVGLAWLLWLTRQLAPAPPGPGLWPLLKSAIALGKVSSLEVFHGQVPPVILSAHFGAFQLGLFNRISNLVSMPVQLLTTSMSRVMVSALAAVAEDRERLKRATALLLRVSAAIMTPLAFGIAGSSYAFTATVLGPKWLAAAPLVPILALTTWSTMMAHLLAVLAEAAREFTAKIRIQIVCSLVLLAGLWIGSAWQLAGAAAGAALASLLSLALYLALTARILAVPFAETLRWLAPGVGAGVACYLATRSIGMGLEGRPAPLVLAVQIAACGAASLGFFALFDRLLLVQTSTAVLPASLHQPVTRLLGVKPSA